MSKGSLFTAFGKDPGEGREAVLDREEPGIRHGEGTRPHWLRFQPRSGRSHEGNANQVSWGWERRPQGGLHGANLGSAPAPSLTSHVVLGKWLNLSVSVSL